ncbi:MAG: type II secretion system protein GspJ [Planctomycetota bacterium]|jgi:type II secretion system protein J
MNTARLNNVSGSRGFTLLEVLVASVIGTFIAIIAVGSLRAVSSASDMIDSNIEDVTEVRYAAKRISTDLMNFYRDRLWSRTLFVGDLIETEDNVSSRLTFYTIGRSKARGGEPEGDVYEVEYFLQRRQEDDRSVLMRRLWPNPSIDYVPGGILMPIAEDIESFEVTYYDGQEWLHVWPQEMETLPDLVEVRLILMRSEKSEPVVSSFIMNYARSTGSEAEESEEDSEGESE